VAATDEVCGPLIGMALNVFDLGGSTPATHRVRTWISDVLGVPVELDRIVSAEHVHLVAVVTNQGP
jgi:hypothetical protein